jgi:hypothetical protein
MSSLKQSLIERILVLAPQGSCDPKVLATHTVESLNGILLQCERDEVATMAESALCSRAEAEASRAILEMNRRADDEPRRQRQEIADRKVFEDAARECGFSAKSQGNWHLLRQILGEGFTVYTIQQLIAGQSEMLSAPTSEELQTWNQERIAARNEFLRNTDGTTLRREARAEIEQARQQQQEEQAAREDAARKQRDAGRFPPLPEMFRGKRLDAAFIRAADKETLRILIKSWGSAQVTDALRTRNSA